MKLKRILFCVMFLGMLLLAGCGSNDGDYNAKEFKANPEYCWPCTMYMQAFKAVDTVLNGTLPTIATNSLIVLKIAFLFWLLFKMGMLVFSISMPDMRKQLPPILTVFFKAFVVAIFLSNSQYIYDLFGGIIIQPIGEAFLSISGMVLDSPNQVGITNITYFTENILNDYLGNLTSSWNNLLSQFNNSGSQMFGGLALKVQEIVFKIFSALWSGVGLGFQLLNAHKFSAFCAALLLIGGMVWLLVMVPLFFVDAFVRIGLVMMLMPLLMVGWVFSYPKDILKKVMHMLLSGFFDILFNCIYVTFLISLFRVYESQKLPYIFSASLQVTEGGLRTEAAQFSTNYIILLLLVWAMLILAGRVQEFTNYFFGASEKSTSVDIANKIKKLAYMGTIGLGLKVIDKTLREAEKKKEEREKAGI